MGKAAGEGISSSGWPTGRMTMCAGVAGEKGISLVGATGREEFLRST